MSALPLPSSLQSDLSPLSVLGIGAVTPSGRDLADLRAKLFESQSDQAGILRVDDSLLSHPAAAVQLRRADRFTRMAVVAATDAWAAASASCAGVAPERIGLILSSGFGPHCRGFKFLDGILDAGDTAASPTDFSHSVHGAAAAYISRLLDIRGPSLSITDFEIGFEEAVRIAQCWLNEKACDRILLGAVEELGAVYLECAERMLPNHKTVPGEGAVFLVVGSEDTRALGRLDAFTVPAAVDLLIVNDSPPFPIAKPPGQLRARQITSFTGLFGQSASASAFAVLGGLLALGEGIDSAAMLRTSSEGQPILLSLEK